jgi:hypothetical protein
MAWHLPPHHMQSNVAIGKQSKIDVDILIFVWTRGDFNGILGSSVGWLILLLHEMKYLCFPLPTQSSKRDEFHPNVVVSSKKSVSSSHLISLVCLAPVLFGEASTNK